MTRVANKITQLAIIGLGSQSRTELIPAIMRLQDKCKIVAVCDINDEFIELTRPLIPNFDKILVFKDYQDLFISTKKNDALRIDGVILSVPHLLHTEITKLAIMKRIKVFKEKPLAINLKEAKEINALAIKEGVQVYTVTKRQFYPAYKTGLQLLNERKIGTPYMYSARHFMPNGNLYAGWRSNMQSAGGGVVIDLGYHLIDIITRYFGDISQANLHWTNIAKPEYIYEVEDSATLHSWHPVGVQGVLQLSALSGPKEETLEIRGTSGRMVVTKQDVTIYDVSGNEKFHHLFEANSIDAVVHALEEYLLDNKLIWSQNISHNMQIMRVIDLAYTKRYK